MTISWELIKQLWRLARNRLCLHKWVEVWNPTPGKHNFYIEECLKCGQRRYRGL